MATTAMVDCVQPGAERVGSAGIASVDESSTQFAC
jgi:hypothetical protein